MFTTADFDIREVGELLFVMGTIRAVFQFRVELELSEFELKSEFRGPYRVQFLFLAFLLER
jgi:hypothetical protein